MKKRLISIIAAVSIAAGLLAGCGQGDSSLTKNIGNDTNREAQAQSDSQKKSQQGQAMGRYAESDIQLPVEASQQIIDIIQLPDGSFELYSPDGEAVKRYIFREGTWQEQEDSLLDGFDLSYNICHIIYGEDNNRYVLYPFGDYQFSLAKLEEGKDPVPMLTEAFSVKTESGYYEMMPDFAAVSEEGNVLLSNRSETKVFTPDGELLFTLPQEFSSMDWKAAGLLKGSIYLTIGDKGFLQYDLSSEEGRLGEEIPYQDSKMDGYTPTAMDEQGGIFLVNANGIHHRNQSGTFWETIVDGKLNSLSMPSLFLRKLFLGQNNDFYVWANSGDNHILKHYTYDETMPSVPTDTLTVYGLNLENAGTIRQAASMFQLDHPDVRVELIDGGIEAGSATVNDTIRALNTELLSGGGADILMLDGLPVDSYIEKGVLEDMKEILQPMIESGELMPNVVNPYTEEGGSIYQIPTRAALMAVYGDQEAIDSLDSMESMRAYQSKASSLPLRPKTTYGNLLRQIAVFYYEEIVDSKNRELIPGKVKEMLETVELLGKACGAKTSFDESEDGGRGRVYNLSNGMEGILGSEYMYYDKGITSISIEKISALYDLMIPNTVIEKYGITMQNFKNLYIPSQILGINKSGKQKELAKEFTAYVLSTEIQGNDLFDGLPVNEKGADQWKEIVKDTMIGVSGDDDYEISGEWPDREERDQLFTIFKNADRPSTTDQTLINILVSETQGYFDGSLTMEQAVQNAENKAKLYFSE